jgi:hypothetical protein
LQQRRQIAAARGALDKNYLWKVVRVRRLEVDTYALVYEACPGGWLNVVWLLLPEQVLQYSKNPKTPETSRQALQSARLGSQELFLTDWTDSFHSNDVLEIVPMQFQTDATDAGFVCRYACACGDNFSNHEEGKGVRKKRHSRKLESDNDVWIQFNLNCTLSEVARGLCVVSGKPYKTQKYIDRWRTQALREVSIPPFALHVNPSGLISEMHTIFTQI